MLKRNFMRFWLKSLIFLQGARRVEAHPYDNLLKKKSSNLVHVKEARDFRHYQQVYT